MHNMFAMYAHIKDDHWAELLPYIQRARNTTYNKSLQETPHLLPVDNILGILCTSGSGTRLKYFRRTVENLQLAYEIACSNLQERTDEQSETNEKHISLGIKC